MRIRNATPGDLEAVQRLLAASDLPADDLTPAHLGHFWVGPSEGTLVCAVGLEPLGDVALLRSLVVAPSQRGRGLGTRLVERAEEEARRQRIEALYLLTTTAARYFGGRGYATVERAALPEAVRATEQAARLCPDSATCMVKRLPPKD